MLALLGIIAGLIYVIGDLPYIRDVLKGKTKPHRTSWFIFFALNLINLANQIALHAKASLWLLSAWALVTGIIAILSIKRGMGGYSRLDIVCAVVAVIGLILWVTLKTPVAALFCDLLVGCIAYVPTIKKSYLLPHTETKISWFTATVASILATISVGNLNYRLLLLPGVGAIVSGIVFTTLMLRSRKV